MVLFLPFLLLSLICENSLFMFICLIVYSNMYLRTKRKLLTYVRFRNPPKERKKCRFFYYSIPTRRQLERRLIIFKEQRKRGGGEGGRIGDTAYQSLGLSQEPFLLADDDFRQLDKEIYVHVTRICEAWCSHFLVTKENRNGAIIGSSPSIIGREISVDFSHRFRMFQYTVINTCRNKINRDYKSFLPMPRRLVRLKQLRRIKCLVQRRKYALMLY